jgi:hypothetical protein
MKVVIERRVNETRKLQKTFCLKSKMKPLKSIFFTSFTSRRRDDEESENEIQEE